MSRTMRDVVVLIPGITGSVLRKHGKVIWGYSGPSLVEAVFTRGDSMREALAIPHDDPSVDDLGDGITADALMPDLHLLPGLWKIDGYTKIVDTIRSSLDVQEGLNFFPFPYDWRRDNRVSARRLQACSQEWLARWRAHSGYEHAKLIIVAHSMGGLVARHFIECLEGWCDTRALITFGTPFRGSLNALDTLVNGMSKGPIELSELAREMQSIYQLLPRYRCVDDGSGSNRRVGEMDGIPNVDAARAAQALAFHHEIDAAVERNQGIKEYVNGFSIHPIVGYAQSTKLSARLRDGALELLTTHDGEDYGGDGTVPRVSAIPIEMSSKPFASFVGTQHGSIQNDDGVLTHLGGLLTMPLATALEEIRGPLRGQIEKVPDARRDVWSPSAQDRAIAIELEDVYASDQPIELRARCSAGTPSLRASLWSDARGTDVQRIDMKRSDDGSWVAQLEPRGAGVHRVRVDGEGKTPAADVFVVTAR